MYKLISLLVMLTAGITLPLAGYSFDVTGDRANLSGTTTSIELTDEGGVLDVVSDNELYGKSWLTYNINLGNPNSVDQGSFSGRATAINTDGSRVTSSRQGVWSMDGYMYSFYSLDDASDGNQYICITTMNLQDDSLEMQFYRK